MEKYEIRNRIHFLASGCNDKERVIGKVSTLCPMLAENLAAALAVDYVKDNPHGAIPWKDSECLLAPKQHQLSASVAYVKVTTPAEYAVAMEALKLPGRIIVKEITSNHPAATAELLGITVFANNTLFHLDFSHVLTRKSVIVETLKFIASLPIFMFYGKRCLELMRGKFVEFRPQNIVDHCIVAESKGLGPGMNDICDYLFGEKFCRRTMASPTESSYSETKQRHLVMINAILHKYVVDHVSDIEWEAARESTVSKLYKKGRTFFKKK